jgi:hypothetical protein
MYRSTFRVNTSVSGSVAGNVRNITMGSVKLVIYCNKLLTKAGVFLVRGKHWSKKEVVQ